MIGAVIDNLIAPFAPAWAMKRTLARHTYEQIRRSYEAGRQDRTTKSWAANQESGDSPNRDEVQRTRWRAWDMYRNNVYARKMVRALVAHVIGCGLKPKPLAEKTGGEPDMAFRKAARAVWRLWCAEADASEPAMPFAQLSALALTEVILSGECFIRVRESANKSIPVTLELINAERVVEEDVRLSDTIEGYVYRGIEFNKEGKRQAYWVYDFHPNDPRLFTFNLNPTRIPAEEIIHLYWKDRPDQIRGVSWFAPQVLQLRDIRDYHENEMMAAMVGSCVVAGIVRTSPAGAFSLQAPTGQSNSDRDGNKITRMQPGMFLNLAPGEDIKGFNPQRPNSQAEAFIQHMLRGAAAGLPGLKASTIHGDYRASSFSSERSADNDCWREIEQVQEWFGFSLCQPIYERVLTAAVVAGAFDDLVDFRSFGAERFKKYKSLYCRCDWHGPVAHSINPSDDETATQLALKNGTTNLEIECARRGLDRDEVLEGRAEDMAKHKELGIPDPAQMEADAMKAKLQPQEEKPDAKAEEPQRLAVIA